MQLCLHLFKEEFKVPQENVGWSFLDLLSLQAVNILGTG